MAAQMQALVCVCARACLLGLSPSIMLYDLTILGLRDQYPSFPKDFSLLSLTLDSCSVLAHTSNPNTGVAKAGES